MDPIDPKNDPKSDTTKVGATAPTDLDNKASNADGSPNDPVVDKNAIDKGEASAAAGAATGDNLDPGNLGKKMPADSVTKTETK